MVHVLLLAIAAVTAGPAPSSPWRSCAVRASVEFVLPAEAGSGAMLGAGSPVPWSVSGRLLPTFVFGKSGKVRLAGMFGAAYTNPGWDALYGGRLGYRPINAPLGLGGVEIAAEVAGGVDNRFPVAASVTLDIGTLVTLHARGTPNVDSKQGFFEFGLGVYLSTIVSELGPPGPVTIDTLIERPPFSAVLTDHVRPVASFALQVMVDTDDQSTLHMDCAKLDDLRALLDTERQSPSGSLAALKTRLTNSGFDEVTQELDQLIEDAIGQYQALNPGASRPSNAEILAGVIVALRDAVDRAERSVLPDHVP